MLLHALIDGRERALLLSDFEELVRAGQIDAETPVRVGDRAAVPARDVQAFQGVAGTPAARFRAAWDRPAIPWVTALVCGLCVRSFLWLGMESHGDIARSSGDILLRGEVWRLLTYAFAHGSLTHIMSNLAFLIFIGISLERVVGGWAIAGLWVWSTGLGGLLALWGSPERPSVGASGADFGFLAAAAVLGWRWFDLIPVAARARFGGAIAAFTVYAFVNGTRNEAVDNWAHFGGLVAGVVYGAMLRPISPQSENRVLAGGAVVAVGVAVAVVWALGWRAMPFELARVDGAQGERPAWWSVGWTEAGGEGWADHPADGGAQAAAGIGTSKRGLDWRREEAEREVLEGYEDADPEANITRSPASRDGVEGAAFDIVWRRTLRQPGGGAENGGRTGGAEDRVPMRSHVEVYVRGHYRHVFSWDLPDDVADADGLLDFARGSWRLVDPAAVVENLKTGEGLRARTLRARSLADVGRRQEALGLFALGEAKELEAALGICAPESTKGCAQVIAAGEARLMGTPEDLAARKAVVSAMLAAGDGAEAMRLIEAGLVLIPLDRGLLLLKERAAVSNGSGTPELPHD